MKIATDTTRAAEEIQRLVLRKLSASDRLRLALEISDAARSLALARLRRQYPDWSEAELKRELIRFAFLASPMPSPRA